MEISRNEERVLRHLLSTKDKGFVREQSLEIESLSDREISSAVSWLDSKGLIELQKETGSRIQLSNEGEEFLEKGLPEERLFLVLQEEGKLPVRKCMDILGPSEGKIALAQLSRFGIRPKAGEISISDPDAIKKEIGRRKKFLVSLREGEKDLPEDLVDHFRKRENVISVRAVTTRLVKISKDGEEYLSTHAEEERIDFLTPDMIVSRSWKGKRFRSYDLNTPVEKIDSASKHPMTYLIERVREIFLSMGFREMKGHYVEYSGWNMDALFIPQDHPARDMQDTFYLKSGKEVEFEHPEILEVLKKVHEKGVEEYPGWQYDWSEKRARELLLRTHTTVSTIRYLYENKEAPLALFSVEKVFRHESVDWKHLAELHQIEGAVHSKEANISTLKWLMRIFYESLGFKDIKFLPSYYPYTEPSIDVVVKINGKEVELGGSGVFRPEVTKPLGLKEPVIAWGLGLERLAMIYYNLSDIREIYNSDLDWLKNFRLIP
ncbi:phenylalanyl-tRNA synthetase subunit alpha [uncultured archaeon]|nr:phenylalanyl-tRNA synthetase subunit alpha [uncultured archaeon]HKJ96125.1 phenylalanine--tRNA ligase subunit alpha [Thermoplasmataceae archaeon]